MPRGEAILPGGLSEGAKRAHDRFLPAFGEHIWIHIYAEGILSPDISSSWATSVQTGFGEFSKIKAYLSEPWPFATASSLLV
jgi:hypothetical protein